MCALDKICSLEPAFNLTLKAWNVVGMLETVRGMLQNVVATKLASWADSVAIKSGKRAESASPDFNVLFKGSLKPRRYLT